MKQMMKSLGLLMLAAAVLASAPGLAQVKSHRDINYPKLPDFDIPQPETYKLENGLTVFLMEDHELPLISVIARVRTGSNYMAGDKEGMGSIFGQVQREGGTTSMTGDEMDDFLEARAAFVETGMGGDEGSASMNCLKEDFDDAFGVFIDVLRNPTFAEEKIELAKVQLNTSIARRNDSVSSIVGREFRRLIYGAGSPLSRLTEYATVASVTRDDLLAWHARHYHPNNIYLGVSGDFDSKQMKEKIKAALEGWPAGPAFDEGDAPYEQPQPGVYFIEKTDVTQANIRAGHLGIKRDNPDYYAVVVMNEVLGGGFSGRLLKNIRSEKGLAYSVFGGIGASFLRPGVFQVGMSTKSSTMAESATALRDEVAGMIENPSSDAELRHAKESILNSFIFNYTSRRQILGQQMTFAFYGLPADYLEQYRANIEKVTAEDVGRVAKKYLHPDKMALLVVGKSEDFDEPVASLGQEVTQIDITIPPPPDTRPQVEKSASNVEQGDRLMAQMARKITGGGDGRVRSGKTSLTVLVQMGGQSMSLGQEVSYVLPDKLRQTVKTPMGDQVVVLNGDEGFVLVGGQTRPIPQERVAEGLQGLGRDLLVLASHVDDPGLEAVAAGTDEVGGAACEIVSVSFHGGESRLCIAEDGKVLKQSYRGKHPFQGTPGLLEVTFSDYADIDGRFLPRKQITAFEGQELATVTTDSQEINVELDASLFELPEGQ